jgi:hypothetical protein
MGLLRSRSCLLRCASSGRKARQKQKEKRQISRDMPLLTSTRASQASIRPFTSCSALWCVCQSHAEPVKSGRPSAGLQGMGSEVKAELDCLSSDIKEATEADATRLSEQEVDSSVLIGGEAKTQGVRVVKYQVYASALAAALLVGSIGTTFAQATVVPGATSGGVGVAGAGTAPVTQGTTPGLAPQSPSVVVPGANVSFFTDPLSVGPSQTPPTGPIGSDPLRVGPAQKPSGQGSPTSAVSSTSSSEACGFPNCLPGEF